MEKEYHQLLTEIKASIRSGRTRAAKQLTRSLIEVYWDIGRQIVESQQKHGWGKSIVERLSQDLKEDFPGRTGFSARNLWDMRKLFDTYKDFSNLRQLVAEIPWSHNLVILQKAKTSEERKYYIEASSKMGWSRNVLLNQIKANAYERHLLLPKQTNFKQTLPKHLAEQADEALKSSYNLEFLGIDKPFLERQLEKRLLEKLKHFLLELGYGFTYVGDQYTLQLDNITYRVDLLFFHRALQCLIAIDLKTGAFQPEHAGKMNFYLELLDEQVKLPNENPSIGIILCAEKNELVVEYALRTSAKPMGVAEYHLSNKLPGKYIGQLPSPEELKEQLKKAKSK